MTEQSSPDLVDQVSPEYAERAWEIGTYQEDDKVGVLDLVRDEYGETDLANGDYFDWLRLACPPDVGQWVVREKGTGRVVSAATMVGVQAIWKGNETKALLGFNFLVAPEYQRQGIHTAFTRQTREDIRRAGYCFTTLFPNPKSMPQLVRSENYHHVSQVPLLVRPLNMRALAEARVKNQLLVWASSLGWGFAGRVIWREPGPPHVDPPLHISEDLVLDEGYDRFWRQVQTKYDLMLVRDRAFLTWRFLDIPTREYRILSARQGDGVLGYIVLRQADARGTMSGIIADFLVLPGEQGTWAGRHLLHEALRQFREAQMPLAGGLVLPHTHEYTLMRDAGFLSVPEPVAPQPFNLFVRSHSDDPPLEALTCPDTWYVSIADHDAV